MLTGSFEVTEPVRHVSLMDCEREFATLGCGRSGAILSQSSVATRK
jgi:hypothetical protein